MSQGMACREFVELVTEYLEGTLPDADRIRFEQHIGDCEGCARYLEQIRETVRLTGTLSEESIDPAARNALLERFRDWKRTNIT